MTRKRTSVQLAGVGLVFFHDLPDLVSLQRRVQHLVQPGVSLPTVDEFHELVQGDEGLPLGAAAAERKAAFRTLEELRSECKREGGKKKRAMDDLSSKMLWISGRRQRLSRNFWKASQVKSSGLSPSDCRTMVSQEKKKEVIRVRNSYFDAIKQQNLATLFCAKRAAEGARGPQRGAADSS